MRTLTASVLVFEAIIIGLAIPVAINVNGAPPELALPLGLGLLVLCLALARWVPAPAAIALGWAVQGVLILGAFVTPVMLVLGIVFAALWATAIRLGGQVDAARSQAPTASVHE